MEPHEQFATNLRRIRESKDLSQEALGHLADIHRTEVSLLERGRRDPQPKTLVKLAAALRASAHAHAGIACEAPNSNDRSTETGA